MLEIWFILETKVGLTGIRVYFGTLSASTRHCIPTPIVPSFFCGAFFLEMKAIASTKQFTLSFSRKQVIPPVALRYLVQLNNPIRPKVKYLCKTRDPNTLWWRISSKDLLDRKKVVRSWCTRRARMAFRQELQARGFDAEGRKLESENQGSATIDGLYGNLTGSVNIVVTPACIQEKYSAVREEMKTLMDSLVRAQQTLKYVQLHHDRTSIKDEAEELHKS
ncbi:hypothetical protein BDW59DRAFT_22589 [Aspergillus cavernicola]|uniref:Uncharacterized protein n=1 Tax=Aspergillus cavernicola TaxID=176166 RepID=A0ABR4IR55_9EURO